jgi:hypothetical protein
MLIEHTYLYDAGVDEVFAIITDASLYEAAAVRSRALTHTAEVTHVHQVHTISLERSLPTDEVPSFAKGFVGDGLVVRETTWWKAGLPGDSSAPGYQATFDVQIVGKPVTFTGSMRLVPEGDGTRQFITGDLKAAVPLFGGKIESAVKDPVDAQIAVVAEMVTERLRG